MKDMYIKTENGSMIIYVDQFFPCGASQFRKLFKIINQFSYLNNVQEMAERLKEHFTEQISILDASRKVIAGAYLKWRQSYVDYGNITASGKYPNGMKLTKEELKEFKTKYRDAKKWAHDYEMDFKWHTRQLEAYKKNLELLQQVG
ncbi:MAG: hypothetical protein NC131_11950 [Roseburia sp.]|nr:hypothetical protein [Roseburia sp.]